MYRRFQLYEFRPPRFKEFCNRRLQIWELRNFCSVCSGSAVYSLDKFFCFLCPVFFCIFSEFFFLNFPPFCPNFYGILLKSGGQLLLFLLPGFYAHVSDFLFCQSRDESTLICYITVAFNVTYFLLLLAYYVPNVRLQDVMQVECNLFTWNCFGDRPQFMVCVDSV